MKIFCWPYKLKPTGTWNQSVRPHGAEGVLLKIEYPNGKIGYSDLHPWPTLADKWLGEQLAILKSGSLTFQLEQSIWMANRDSQGRAAKKSIDFDTHKIANHFFLAEGLAVTEATLTEAEGSGFRSVKLKVGNDSNQEIQFLNSMVPKFNLKWRLDFNAKLDLIGFTSFWNKLLPEVKSKIEYVEDPTRFSQNDWLEINRFVDVAIDNQISEVDWAVDWDALIVKAFKIIVIKPAVQDPDDLFRKAEERDLKVVVTSYLDHPIGTVHAAWIAQELKEKNPNRVIDCGLLSFRAYSYSDFVSLVETSGPYIKKVHGVGVGFDILLERIDWKLLKA